MKFELKKILVLILWIGLGFIAISILAFLFIAFMYRINDFLLFSWIIPNGAEGETPTNSAETIRNFAWLFWMFLSLSGAGLGLWLAWQGRQIHRDQWQTQRESHLQERFEKASDMLSSEIELTRIAGCRSLMNLGKSDDSMKSQCVHLLFAFISNPYLGDDDKGKSLDELFPPDKALRSDIIEAMVSFSNIYKHYSEVGVDDEVVRLPSYFWKSEGRGVISLIKASVRWVDLTEANLFMADLRESIFFAISLRKANLYAANLQGADFHLADLRWADLGAAKLQGADISSARMQEAENLTKEQILSTKWGYNRYGEGGPPKLPEYLMQDEDIKKWLETPAYDKRKNPKNSQ